MYIKNPKGINKTILPITLQINCPNGYSKSIVIIILNGTILNISNPSNLYPSLIGNNVNDIINNIDKNKKRFKISDLQFIEIFFMYLYMVEIPKYKNVIPNNIKPENSITNLTPLDLY